MTNAGSLIIYHLTLKLGIWNWPPSVFMGSEHMSTLTILRAFCFVSLYGPSGETNIEDMTSQKPHYFPFNASILTTFSIGIQER